MQSRNLNVFQRKRNETTLIVMQRKERFKFESVLSINRIYNTEQPSRYFNLFYQTVTVTKTVLTRKKTSFELSTGGIFCTTI